MWYCESCGSLLELVMWYNESCCGMFELMMWNCQSCSGSPELVMWYCESSGGRHELVMWSAWVGYVVLWVMWLCASSGRVVLFHGAVMWCCVCRRSDVVLCFQEEWCGVVFPGGVMWCFVSRRSDVVFCFRQWSCCCLYGLYLLLSVLKKAWSGRRNGRALPVARMGWVAVSANPHSISLAVWGSACVRMVEHGPHPPLNVSDLSFPPCGIFVIGFVGKGIALDRSIITGGLLPVPQKASAWRVIVVLRTLCWDLLWTLGLTCPAICSAVGGELGSCWKGVCVWSSGVSSSWHAEIMKLSMDIKQYRYSHFIVILVPTVAWILTIVLIVAMSGCGFPGFLDLEIVQRFRRYLTQHPSMVRLTSMIFFYPQLWGWNRVTLSQSRSTDCPLLQWMIF